MKTEHQFNKAIGFAVSGIKHYDTEVYRNSADSFAALSVTGVVCKQGCPHCGGLLLHSMYDAEKPGDFINRVDKLAEAGCSGILVSGGCDGGAVPLMRYSDGIAHARRRYLKVVVHTGLLDKETAAALKSANVDRILMDVIGSKKTISKVYGIDKTPEDFFESLLIGKDAGLDISPHLVVGLDFGVTDGEYAAIEMVRRAGVQSFVLVVLTPKRGTKMQGVLPPPLPDVIKVFEYAAGTLDDVNIMLGCSRPSSYTAELEKTAVDLAFAAISYPRVETVRYAQEQGYNTCFFELCCCLVC